MTTANVPTVYMKYYKDVAQSTHAAHAAQSTNAAQPQQVLQSKLSDDNPTKQAERDWPKHRLTIANKRPCNCSLCDFDAFPSVLPGVLPPRAPATCTGLAKVDELLLDGRYQMVKILSTKTAECDAPDSDVWSAVQCATKEDCVIKLARSDRARAELENEREILAGPLRDCLGVPTLVEATDVSTESQSYSVLVERPLGFRSQSKLGIVSTKEANRIVMRWAEQLVKTLQEIHRRGIIHGDIKPDNIVISEKGVPILIDFGISQYIAKAAVPTRGTLLFSSRGNLLGQKASCADDFESLCYTLHALVDPGRYASFERRPKWRKVLNSCPAARFVARTTGLSTSN